MRGSQSFLLAVAALLLAEAAGTARAQIDFNVPPKKEIDLDAYGGYPVTQSEVGAEPKNLDDREIMFPTAGTCKEKGVQPTDCTQECLYECKDPVCSMSCLCACGGQAAKANLVAQLKQAEGRMKREIQLLGSESQLWDSAPVDKQEHAQMSRSSIAFKAHEKHRLNRLLQRNQQHKGQFAKSYRRPASKRVPAEDGFDWVKMTDAPTPQIERMSESPYASESDTIDAVYDPSMDWTNQGRTKTARPEWWENAKSWDKHTPEDVQ
jgi:hypothetical protein